MPNLAFRKNSPDELYEPDFQAAYAAGLADFQTPAAQDTRRILAWLVDIQIDFVFPAPIGRLTVPNALADTARTVEWLYRNVHQISRISASLDTHSPLQIFYPSWWINASGERPAAYTIISAEDVQNGVWMPTLEVEWSKSYVEQLESGGKKQLMIWPFHCMEGTNGRALVPALSEAIMYHSGARAVQPHYLIKGMIPQTEYYSVVEPEVKYSSDPDGNINREFLEGLQGYDLIYIGGQARSHCVLETLNSLMRYFEDQPDFIQKLRFLNDCSSSIGGFEAETEARLQTFAQKGMHFVQSSDPIN